MALSDLTAAVANIKRRAASASVLDTSGTPTWRSLGIIKQPKVNIEEVIDEVDTRGRSKQLGVNLSIELVMKQTSDVEIGELENLTEDAIDFFISEDLGIDPATSTGWRFNQSLLNISGAIDLGGGESMFTVKVNGQLSMAELASLASGTVTWGE